MTARSDGPRYRVERRPDFENLRRTLLRQGPPGPVPLIELFADPGTIQALLGEKIGWDSIMLTEAGDSASQRRPSWRGRAVLDLILRFCYENGYDYVWTWTGLGFPRAGTIWRPRTPPASRTSPAARDCGRTRAGGPSRAGPTSTPTPGRLAERISYRAIEYLNSVVPEGMKISVNLAGSSRTAPG